MRATGTVYVTRRTKVVALAIAVAVAVVLLHGVAVAGAAPPTAAQAQELEGRVRVNEREVSSLRSQLDWTIYPVTALIGVLAFGGILGVVFSIRDQRRVTQLHELAVRGETAAQRRSEESFSAFLSESQKTLTLVNDTLRLAKESTDRAAHTMQANAETRVNTIEGRAEALMLRAFRTSEFESILDDLELRNDLGRIARDLAGLESYLELQNLPLPPHCRFVKAIDRFLKDDTRGALELLQRAEQEARPGELHRFTLYWIGYMQLTVGEYESARRKFHDDEGGLRTADREHHQLERMELEAEFFEAASDLERNGQNTPNARFRKTKKLIAKLDGLAERVRASDHARKSRTSHEVARTRADVLAWIGYEAGRDPLRQDDIDAATKLAEPATEQAPSVIRAWALRRAYDVCDEQTDRDFYLEFTRAECARVLNLRGAPAAYEAVTEMLVAEAGKHRETRREAELAQVSAICHVQLASTPSGPEDAPGEGRKAPTPTPSDASDIAANASLTQGATSRGEHRNAAAVAASKAAETSRTLAHTEITIFSALCRHNISPEAFTREVSGLIEVGRGGGQSAAAVR